MPHSMEILAAQRIPMFPKQSIRLRIRAQLTVVDEFRIPHFDRIDSVQNVGRNDVVIADRVRDSRYPPCAPHLVTPTQNVAILEPIIHAESQNMVSAKAALISRDHKTLWNIPACSHQAPER